MQARRSGFLYYRKCELGEKVKATARVKVISPTLIRLIRLSTTALCVDRVREHMLAK